MCWVSLLVFDVLKGSGEASLRVLALQSNRAEHLAKLYALESLEWEPLDKNRRLEHQLVVVKVLNGAS